MGNKNVDEIVIVVGLWTDGETWLSTHLKWTRLGKNEKEATASFNTKMELIASLSYS